MNMLRACLLLILLGTLATTSAFAADAWIINSQDDWTDATETQTQLEIKEGTAIPTDKVATFTSRIKRFDQKRKAKSLTIAQSPVWQNWEPVANLGPVNLQDAPVFLAIGPNNYRVYFGFD